MAEDVLVRLRIAGEEFSRDVKGAFAGVTTEAAAAGSKAGAALADGIRPQSEIVRRSLAEAEQGVAKYGSALSRSESIIRQYAAAQGSARSMVDAARAAYKAGEISVEEFYEAQTRARLEVVESRVAYNALTREMRLMGQASTGTRAAMGAVTVSAGQQQAGMQQLSYQIGDVAQQFALGASPMQIFAAQGSQVVQAVTLMRGATGGLSGFIAGPWGAAIIGGVTVLGMFASKFGEAEEAAKQAEFASNSFADAQGILGNVVDLATGKINTQVEAYHALARAQAIAGRINAETRAAAARSTISDARDPEWRFGGGLGGGFSIGRERPIQGQVASQVLNEVVSPEEAIKRLDKLQRAGKVTKEEFLDLASAIANLGVETENIKVFERLEDALNGDTRAMEGFLRVNTRVQRKKRETLSDEEKAYKQAKEEGDRYINSLETEIERMGLTAGQLRQLEVARAKEAAATQEQRDRMEELNAAREVAYSDAARKADVERANKAAEDFERNVIGPLEKEISLLGLVGPARDRAALALEEQGFKAQMAAQGIEDVNAAWERYAKAQGQLIDFHEAEDQIRTLGDLWRDVFDDGVGSIWDRFADLGKNAIAEVAARWTMAMLAGQPFDLGAATSQAIYRDPISSIFFGSGIFGAANDNGPGAATAVASAASGGHWAVPGGGGPMALPGAAGGMGGILGGAGSIAGPVGLYLAGVQVSNLLGGAIENLTGLEYSKTGGMFGGLLGGFLGGALKSTKRGSAIIGGSGGDLGITGYYGNSSSRKDQAGGLAGGLIDTIQQIADALGAEVDASRGKVSIGIRKDSINVDPQGRGYTKTSKYSDIRAFGQDEAAAQAFAIRDLIADGIFPSLSAASKRLLQLPGDLEEAIEKASLIESVPKLLAARLDPLGSALDEIYRKHVKIAEALREGAASEEQIAEARQLWELEKADAIESIGAASETLKDYLLSLNAGGNSPLSLRKQEAEAEAALAPYVAQMEAAQAARDEVERLKAGGGTAAEIEAAEKAARLAAGKFDQGGFTDASQLLLGISRQIDASSGGFFEDFERIRALTQQGIGLIDGAAPAVDDRDPYGQALVNHAAEQVHVLEEIRDLQGRLLQVLGSSGGPSLGNQFFSSQRSFSAS